MNSQESEKIPEVNENISSGSDSTPKGFAMPKEDDLIDEIVLGEEQQSITVQDESAQAKKEGCEAVEQETPVQDQDDVQAVKADQAKEVKKTAMEAVLEGFDNDGHKETEEASVEHQAKQSQQQETPEEQAQNDDSDIDVLIKRRPPVSRPAAAPTDTKKPGDTELDPPINYKLPPRGSIITNTSASPTKARIVLDILCGNYNFKTPRVFNDRPTKVKFLMRNYARSPFMLLGSLMYVITAIMLLIPLFGTLFPNISEIADSFSGVMSNPSEKYLMALARSLLAVAAITVIIIPILIKLVGILLTVLQGFKKNFDVFGLTCIKRATVLATVILVVVMVGMLAINVLVLKFETGDDFKSVVPSKNLFKLFIPVIIAIIVAAITSDMLNKGMDQAEFGSTKGSASIVFGSIQVISMGFIIFAMIKLSDILKMLKEFEASDVTVKEVLGPLTKLLENSGAWVLVPTLVSTISFGAVIFLHRESMRRVKKEYFHDSE